MRIYSVVVKIVTPALLVLLPFVVPMFVLTANVNDLLGVVSIFFVIILGFFIAAATSGYLGFQSSIAQENSMLIALFNLSKIIDPSAAGNIGNLIDRYVIQTLDYKIGEYADHTEREYSDIIEAIDALRIHPKNKEGAAVFSYMHQVKINLLKIRQDVFQSSRNVVRAIHWAILIIFSLLIVVLLLSMRDGSVITGIAIGMTIMGLYLTLVLLYELDRNVFLEEQLAYSDAQKVFEAISKLPYYPGYALAQGVVQKPRAPYRIGVYKNYPASLEKVVRTVENP